MSQGSTSARKDDVMFHVGSRKDHFWLIQFSIFPFSLLSSALEWTAFLTLVCQSVSILYWCRCKFNYRLQRSSKVGFHITWRPRTWFTVMLLFSSYTFFVYFILFYLLDSVASLWCMGMSLKLSSWCKILFQHFSILVFFIIFHYEYPMLL